MKKLRMGHDPRKLKANTEFIQVAERVMNTHAPVFQKLAEIEKIQLTPTIIEQKVVENHHHTTETIVKETKTQDKLARKHSKLLKKAMNKDLTEMTEVLNVQNDRIQELISATKKLADKNDELSAKLLEQKPEEKQVVKQETIIVEGKPNKLMVAGIILSIVLSALALVIK